MPEIAPPATPIVPTRVDVAWTHGPLDSYASDVTAVAPLAPPDHAAQAQLTARTYRQLLGDPKLVELHDTTDGSDGAEVSSLLDAARGVRGLSGNPEIQAQNQARVNISVLFSDGSFNEVLYGKEHLPGPAQAVVDAAGSILAAHKGENESIPF